MSFFAPGFPTLPGGPVTSPARAVVAPMPTVAVTISATTHAAFFVLLMVPSLGAGDGPSAPTPPSLRSPRALCPTPEKDGSAPFRSRTERADLVERSVQGSGSRAARIARDPSGSDGAAGPALESPLPVLRSEEPRG